MKPRNALTVREICLFGILGAMTFAAKYIMSFLPNIEPVSLLVMVFVAVFGLKALFPIYLYVLLEILFYGLGLWNVNYLYVWAVLALAAWLLRGMNQPLGWAMLSGLFGLSFGALCGLADLPIGGWEYTLAKWVSGIPFDLTHGIGNFVIALLLFVPTRNLLARLWQRMH